MKINRRDKRRAHFQVSFNRYKFIRLFCFCWAFFSLGLGALYWHLDKVYEERQILLKEQLMSELQQLERHYQQSPVSSLYEGVVRLEGVVDYGTLEYLNARPHDYAQHSELLKVKAQHRVLEPGMEEIRFIQLDSK